MWVHQFMPTAATHSSKSTAGGSTSDHSTHSGASKVYVVQAGDSLGGIADRFGVSLGSLEAANPQVTDPNLIAPGESLQIPES